jgi:hypothetical protein
MILSDQHPVLPASPFPSDHAMDARFSGQTPAQLPGLQTMFQSREFKGFSRP